MSLPACLQVPAGLRGGSQQGLPPAALGAPRGLDVPCVLGEAPSSHHMPGRPLLGLQTPRTYPGEQRWWPQRQGLGSQAAGSMLSCKQGREDVTRRMRGAAHQAQREGPGRPWGVGCRSAREVCCRVDGCSSGWTKPSRENPWALTHWRQWGPSTNVHPRTCPSAMPPP